MILLDTCVLVFDALAPDRLSGVARDALARAEVAGALACADISLWEIVMLISKGRLDPGTNATEFLEDVIAARRLRVLPITPQIAGLAQETGLTRGDPADRLIAATAIHLGARLITADTTLRALKAVDTIW